MARYIRSTGRYRLIGVIGLAIAILSIFRASMWNKRTPRWEYWVDVFPAGLGYSMYLCCALGMLRVCRTTLTLISRSHLVS